MGKIESKATKEQIAIWKAKYGDVFEVSVEGKYCYLRKPDRKTLSFGSTIGVSDPMKFNEIVLANCWIEGDEMLKTDDECFFAVIQRLNELIEVKTAEIKKL